MKRFFKKRFLGIPVLVVLMVALAGITVLAVSGLINLNLDSSGGIMVTEVPTYDIDTQTLDFVQSDDPAYVGYPVDAYATITVTNTGDQTITGWHIGRTDLEDIPGFVSITFDGSAYPGGLAVDATGTIRWIVSVTPTQAGLIDLSGLTFTLKPAY